MRHVYPKTLLIVCMKSKVTRCPVFYLTALELKCTMEGAVLNNTDYSIALQEEENTTH